MGLRLRRRRPQLREHARVQRFRQRILGVNNRAARHLVIQEKGRPARAGADRQHGFPVRLERLAQGRCRQQHAVLIGLNPFQFGPLRRIEKARGIDAREEHGVAKNAVTLGIGARRNRGCVHAGHRRIHGVMIGIDDPALPQRVQVRHEVGGHVIRSKAVEHEQKMSVRRLRREADGEQCQEQKDAADARH